jgi:hypothetical protein
MKSKRITILATVLLTVACFGVLSGFQKSDIARKPIWIYKVVSMNAYAQDKDVENKVNELGKDNWELVAVEGTTFNNVGLLSDQVSGSPERILTSHRYIFRRQQQ